MKILVLGCGPAGLLAVHAAAQRDDECQVIVLSRKRKSPLHGCQFLHEPIPLSGSGLVASEALRSTSVCYQLRGTAEQYAEKVYGPHRLPTTVSPQLYLGDRLAWDLRQAYHWLWRAYHDMIIEADLTPTLVVQALREFKADLVISTIPAPVLCQQGEAHTFSSVRCWAVGDTEDGLGRVPFPTQRDTIICDGTRGAGYYRLSNVFGIATVEWPGQRTKPPISGIAPFDKPLSTNCDCLPEIHRLGRYGAWTKGILTHHVYAHTLNLINQRLGHDGAH